MQAENGFSRRHDGDIAQGLWRIVDPKITLASVASMVLGTAFAGHDGALHAGWLAVTVAGIFCIEAAKNASGEIVDWYSGADQGIRVEERSPFSGGKRVIVDGLLTPLQTSITAAVLYALGAAAGLAIVVLREPQVLWLGLAGVALAYFYHAPPLRLAYCGLGELAVALAYGPIIAVGTYLVQRGGISTDLVLASLPLGLAIAAFLWINEFPDARADAEAGKRTLVVRLGPYRAARVFSLLCALTYLGVALLPAAGLPVGVVLGAVGVVPAGFAARRLLQAPTTASRIVPAQALTLLAFVLLSLGLSLGLSVPI